MTELQKTPSNAGHPPDDSFSLTDACFQVEQASESNSEKFVVFCLNDELFAVPAERVVEVFHLPSSITPLPNTPEWLMGITNLRGEIVSVVDLQKFQSGKSSTLSPKSKLIVYRSKRSDVSIVFAADKLSEILALSESEIDFSARKRQFISGSACFKSKTLNLIDIEEIIAARNLAALQN